MSLKIHPLHDRVIVVRHEEETKTAGGIYLPNADKEKPARGKVVAVGPGKSLESGQIRPLVVKVGQEVFFAKYAGTEVKYDDKEYVVIREDEIMCVVE